MVKNLPANAGDAAPTPGLGRPSKLQPSPVSLPGKSHRQRSLAGHRVTKEPDTTGAT